MQLSIQKLTGIDNLGEELTLNFLVQCNAYIQVYKGVLIYVTSLSLEDQTIFSKNLQSTEFKQ